MYYENENEKKAIEMLCDLALKQSGVQAIQLVNGVLSNAKLYVEQKENKEKK